jgi:hypothetical protein
MRTHPHAVVVDPHARLVRLPGDYGSTQPPRKYGINQGGKISYMTNYEETAAGAAAVILVRKVFGEWKRVVGFKMLTREAFGMCRNRILRVGWKGLWR